MKDGRLVWIDAAYFCAGVVINEKGVVIEAAPILYWSLGKHYSKIVEFLKRKRAFKRLEILP